MRMVRTAAALAGLTLVPSLLWAQNGSSGGFRDSWYWGVNGGAMMFNAGYDEDVKVTAPTVGGEWFITRTRIALRLAVQQAFFDKQAAVYDPTVAGAARPVNVKDWRRYSGEIYFLPSGEGSFKPYLGLGLALNVLQNAAPVGSFVSEESLEEVFTLVDEFSSRASLIVAAGAQFNLGRSGVFVQANVMPTREAFLLSRSQYTIGLEAGIRYNVGSAIEKF
jgi:hypothetical protein